MQWNRAKLIHCFSQLMFQNIRDWEPAPKGYWFCIVIKWYNTMKGHKTHWTGALLWCVMWKCCFYCRIKCTTMCFIELNGSWHTTAMLFRMLVQIVAFYYIAHTNTWLPWGGQQNFNQNRGNVCLSSTIPRLNNYLVVNIACFSLCVGPFKFHTKIM